MNDYWSQYVQTSEELYASRALRFHGGNRDLWLDMLGAKDGMKVLEVGCGSGIFCHRIKSFLPGCDVTGLDFDTGHIAYAERKAAALGLDCRFINADATAMPFEDAAFDLCFSHTVMEHVPNGPFLREQLRVLKPGGRIALISVRTKMGLNAVPWLAEDGRERELREKLFLVAQSRQGRESIGAYEMREEDYPRTLEEAGFQEARIDFFNATWYAPDNAGVSEAMATEMIECLRLASVASLEKAVRLAPDVLTGSEKDEVYGLTNARFDNRLQTWRRGEKLWDICVCAMLAASARKAE